MKKSPITTHILDTSSGAPAQGVRVELFQRNGDAKERIGEGVTDADGRVSDLLAPDSLQSGIYELHFAVGEYYAGRGEKTFYPEARITFEVGEPAEHYHVPLLLNPFGYSTYRGS